MLQNQVLVMAQ